jgi:DNA-binding IclR family transcriptional regulator
MDPAHDDDAKQTENRNVGRLITILDVLAKGNRNGLRLVDVAEQAQLGRATTHRLLATLAARGLAEHDPDTGRYFIGMKMLGWAAAIKDRFIFARLAEPALERLCQATNDTAYLIGRIGDESVCLACHEGAYPIKVLSLATGDRRPLGIGAGSLAILAALPDDEFERIMVTQANARSAYPLDDMTLRRMVNAARHDGYAFNNLHLFPRMEAIVDMAGVAVPVRRSDGMPVAALHVTGVTARLAQPRRASIVSLLQDEARQLQEQLEPVIDELHWGGRSRSAPPSV